MAGYLSSAHFHNEAAAFAFIEARVWPTGPFCPHCGGVERIGRLQGKSTRHGVMKCYDCRKPFTVRVGTIFEDSHVKLHLWLQAIFLVASSKKGISANQLHRTLGVTLKTAWFMGHRIREAMRDTTNAILGGDGTKGIVEADETYIGRTEGQGKGPHLSKKRKVLSLMERGGKVRSFHVQRVTTETLAPIMEKHIAQTARLMTDTASVYGKIGGLFASHETVNHLADEYARGDVTTNSVEGYFGIFKRGLFGTYQHCGENHLHRYLSEFDFRHNNRKSLGINDAERAENVVKGVVGKRLMYKTVGSTAA
jgi:transposase-like protein